MIDGRGSVRIGARGLAAVCLWTAACSAGGAQPADASAPVASKPSALELSSKRERAIDVLEQLAKSESAQVRANAVEALSAAPARASRVVGDRLLDANEGVRSVAAMVAGRLRMREHADRLESMTDDTSPFVRASAIYALRRCGVERDPSVLADLLLESPDPRVRAHAAYILGELGDRSAMGLLRQATGESMPRANASRVQLLKLQIAEAMIKLGDEGQLSVIRAALYPARPEELEATALAVQILGEVEDRGAVDQLIDLSRSAGETDRVMPAEVRLAAAGSLAKLGLPQGGFIADEYASSDRVVLRAQAASVYGETGRAETVGALDRLLEDESPLVRVAAAGAMVKVGTGGRSARARDD